MPEATLQQTGVRALVSTAVRSIPGVARLGRGKSITIHPADGGLVVECYVSAAADVYLPNLGLAIQATVAAVLRDIAGLVAREVHVYILDVEASRG